MKYFVCVLALLSISWEPMKKFGEADLYYDCDGNFYMIYKRHYYQLVHIVHDLNICECVAGNEILD